ncbi:MAG: glycerol kinase [Haloferacaceae archaeon]
MLLGINQNTTGTTAAVFDSTLSMVSVGHARLERLTPRSGRVEIDPADLLANVTLAVSRALDTDDVDAADVDVVGLANQGETALCWDADGRPLHNALVWQDRRTAGRCEQLLEDEDLSRYIKETTGLHIDPYFSATKLEWLVDHADADPSELYCGTTDTWLLWQLLDDDPFVTDHATASRTMLFDLQRNQWDDRLREVFGLDDVQLPTPVANDVVVGETDPDEFVGIDAPVAGCITNQQAALYGQGCTSPGDTKCTYRTGSFILMNVGKTPAWYIDGISGTVAWTLDGETTYALDGGIYTTGAFIDWLVDSVEFLDEGDDTSALARSVPSSNGVYAVPALSGLASPYWDSSARGAFVGLDSSTTKAHLARASLEGIAHRVRDVVDAMTDETVIEMDELKVDGELTANEFLLQYQADLLDHTLAVSAIPEASALGTATIAGEAVGLDVDTSRLGASERTVTSSRRTAALDDKHEEWQVVVEAIRDLSRKLDHA